MALYVELPPFRRFSVTGVACRMADKSRACHRGKQAIAAVSERCFISNIRGVPHRWNRCFFLSQARTSDTGEPWVVDARLSFSARSFKESGAGPKTIF
jgi:hypothetical protein